MTLLVPGSLLWREFPVAGVLEPAGPSLDLGFLNGTLDSHITFSRASAATSGIFTDAAGSAYTSYATGVARATPRGFLLEEQRTNSLLNSDTPATQTTASLASGTYTLWVIGTGSATSSAGTAVGSGFGAATAGTPNTFTLSVGGTVVVTKAGTLTRFQLENGAFPTSYIPTTGATATRSADVASMALGSWFNRTVISVAMDLLVLQAGSSVAFDGPCDFNDGGANRVLFYTGPGTTHIHLENANVSDNDIGSYVSGTAFKIAGTVSSAGASGCLNGGAISSGPSSPFPGSLLTTLNIGSLVGGANTLDGYVRRLRYWPRSLSNAELQQVTT